MSSLAVANASAASPYLPKALRITRVTQEIPSVFTFTCDMPAGFAFLPGQFNMLYVHGVGEVPISISGDPADDKHLVHTIKAVGNVTRALEKLTEGATIGVRGPFGTAWPVAQAKGRDVLFIAGGLGLAPLRPAILHVLANRIDYGRVAILYGARSPADLLFRSELHAWRGRFDLRVEAIVDVAERDWLGRVGVVTRLLEDLPLDTDDAVFVCGPEIMMRFVARELEGRGVPRTSVWLSLERNMKCGVGLCGHCQLGDAFLCKDGPVLRLDRAARLLAVKEL
jgi:NAD(P)H-flavin reductase